MSDEKLRAAYERQVAANAPVDRSKCPSTELLQEMAEMGQGGSDENLKTMDHIFGCMYCRADFALLRSVEVGAMRAGNTVLAAQSNRWFTGPRIAFAATLLLAIGIGTETVRRRNNSTVRAGSEAADIIVVSPAANAVVTAAPPFVWHKVAGADSYEIQLLDTTGVVITSQVTSDTTYIPPVSMQLHLNQLPAFDWLISARRSDGNERRSSVMRVRVKPTGQP